MPVMTESVADALIAAFQSRLPTRLAEIAAERAAADAARGETVPLVTPALYLFGDRLQEPNQLPAVVISDEGTEVSTVGPTVGTSTGWAEMTHTLGVTVWLSADTEQTSARQLARFKQAVWAVLTEKQVITGERAYVLIPRRGTSEKRGGGVRNVSWQVQVNSLEHLT